MHQYNLLLRLTAFYPDFQLTLAERDKRLPRYVERGFDKFLHCGHLEYSFFAGGVYRPFMKP